MSDQVDADGIGRLVRWTGCPVGCGRNGHEWPCTVGRDLPGDWNLFIDKNGVQSWTARHRKNLMRPRPGCCKVCGRQLDRQAVRVDDTRCTACYQAIFRSISASVFRGPRERGEPA